MEDFLEKFKSALLDGSYENWICFEQKRLSLLKIEYRFVPGETIHIIYDKVMNGTITFRNDINFNAFMISQIKSIIANGLKRITNCFDGYKDENELENSSNGNGELSEYELKIIEESYDFERLEQICYEEILQNDTEAGICLLEKTRGMCVKETAESYNITEDEVTNALRRAKYKMEKYLPEEFKQLIK